MRKIKLENMEFKAMEDFDNSTLPLIDTLLTSDGDSPLTFKGGQVYRDGEDGMYKVSKRVVYAPDPRYTDQYSDITDIIELLDRRYEDNLLRGCVIDHKKKRVMLLNGDAERGVKLGRALNPTCDAITISFRCLQRFFFEDDDDLAIEEFIAFLDKGAIELLDYSKDNRIPLTKNEQNQLRRKNGYGKLAENPPENGYSLIRSDGTREGKAHWHRAASALLRCKKSGMTILMGQDDGSYFGTELSGQPKTLKAAYLDLMPKEVRGKPFVRQGEWFIVEVADNEVPSVKDSICEFTCLVLPRESDDSNRHELDEADDGRITKDGQIFARNGELRHSDHPTVELRAIDPEKQWVTFYCNTAKRSFSEQGVD